MFTDGSLNPQLEKLGYSKFNTPEALAEVSQRFGEGVKDFLASDRHEERWTKFNSHQSWEVGIDQVNSQ